ncbi:hypothetical protein [Rhizobium mongolense]|uniref:hypothetical protein n=1 Tax=Rhizobium mongolense TaxID=57676 RepID=UPI0034A187B4
MDKFFNVPSDYAKKGQHFGVAFLLIGAVAAVAAAIEPLTATAFFSALTTFIGTILTMWATAVQERRANADLASASSRAAQAEAKAAESQLQLANYRKPRALSEQTALEISKAAMIYRGQIFSGLVADGVPDARPLWGQLVTTLQAAGWKLAQPRGLSVGSPPAGVPIAPGVGITVFAPIYGDARAKSAAVDVCNALVAAGLETKLEAHAENGRNLIVSIEIGSRPL